MTNRSTLSTTSTARPAFAWCPLLGAALLAGCPPPPTPELQTTPVGVIVGQVFTDVPERASLGGAEVTLLGTSSRAISEAGRQFALPAVPVGEHTLSISHAPSGQVARVEVTVSQAFQTVLLTEDETTLQQAAIVTGTVTGGELATAKVFVVGGTQSQQVDVLADGTFEIDQLPPGEARIGAWGPGMSSSLESVTLVSGENSLNNALRLEDNAVDGITLSGTAILTDSPDQQGTVVFLNGGEYIATTDAAGGFTIDDVAPGGYLLSAERPGYAPGVSAVFAVGSDGTIEGGFDVFLSPGSPDPVLPDVPTTDEEVGELTVAIESTAVDQTIEEGLGVSFVANIGNAGEQPVTLLWSSRENVDGTTFDPLCDPCTDTALSDVIFDVGAHIVRAEVTDGDRTSFVDYSLLVTALAITVTIDSPGSGDVFRPDQDVTLDASVTVRPGLVEELVWSRGPCTDLSQVIATGNGQTVVLGSDATVVTLCASASVPGYGTVATDEVVIAVPNVDAVLQVAAYSGTYGVTQPALLDNGPGLPRSVTIQQGLPAQVVVTESDPDLVVSWVSDTAVTVDGPVLDLSTLDVDLHTFTVTATLSGAPVFTEDIVVVIQPLVFDITVLQPLLSPPVPYIAEDGLPVQIDINHGWQGTFSALSVLWRNAAGVIVGQGTNTLVTGLDAGPGVLNVEVVDLTGERRSATVPYLLDTVNLSVAFLQPSGPTTLTAGEVLTVEVDVTHTLLGTTLGEADFTTEVWTAHTGWLAAAWNTPIPITGLSSGEHLVLARVTENGTPRQAQASETVTVLDAALLTVGRSFPADDEIDLLNGPLGAWTFFVSNETPQTEYRWYLDGLPFAAGWLGHDTPAPTDEARLSLAAGTYDRGASPWDDARWQEGTHVVELCASNDPATNPREVCSGFTARAFATETVQPSGLNVNDGVTVTMSGLNFVNGDWVIRNGGRVIVEPGAKLIMGPSSRFTIQGELLVGQLGGAPVEMVSGAADPQGGDWDGIDARGNGLQPGRVVMESTVMRHAITCVFMGATAWGDDGDVLELRDFTCEDSDSGTTGGCPEVLEGGAFRRLDNGLVEPVSNAPSCKPGRVYDGVTFEQLGAPGLHPNSTWGDLTVRNCVFRGNDGIDFETNSLAGSVDVVIEDSLFENIPANSLRTRNIGTGTLTIRHSTFAGGATGLRLEGAGGPGVDEVAVSVIGNRFIDVDVPVYMVGPRPEAPDIHGNTFEGFDSLLKTDITTGVAWTTWTEIDARGNWLGDTGDIASVGGAQWANPVGESLNTPTVDDRWDNPAVPVVARFDNPLTEPFATGAEPLAYAAEPDQSQSYHKDFCVPLKAVAIEPGFDANACSFTDVATGTLLSTDSDGCIVEAEVDILVDGENLVSMVCTDGTRTTAQQVRFYAARNRVSGPTHRVNEVWDADAVIASDIIVPANTTLTVTEGIELLIAAGDVRLSQDAAVTTPDITSVLTTDFLVYGDLAFEGTSGAPVVIQPESGGQVIGSWGDVLAVGASASVRYTFTELTGARLAASGRAASNADVPTIHFEDTTVTAVDALVDGTCPQLFDRVTVLSSNTLVGGPVGSGPRRAICANNLLVRELNATDHVQTGFLVELDGAVPSALLTVLDSTFERRPNRSNDFIVGVGMGVEIERTTLRNLNQVASAPLIATPVANFLLRDAWVENFEAVTITGSNVTTPMTMDGTVFLDGTNVLNGRFQDSVMTGCRVEDVLEPFVVNMRSGDLTITGNGFLRPVTIVRVSGFTAGNLIVMSGNNFTDIQNLGVQNNFIPVSTGLNATGNYWGTGLENVVESLIDDSGADFPGDDLVGATDYSGWTNLPIFLTLP